MMWQVLLRLAALDQLPRMLHARAIFAGEVLSMLAHFDTMDMR
jgi:hypothetical protein